ncbi:sugar O-acetyltransferase [Rubritalea tangerina]|uniref:Sugar O-acetyltransferase n=2 Tax=Rubritalea tangerina TaxID=430798 RepID=A0ABW4ZBH5_9BACT
MHDDTPKEFDSSTPERLAQIARARALTLQYNQLPADDPAARSQLLKQLLGSLGSDAYIDTPFHCDYGKNIHVGANVYIGLNCTFIDNESIHIGDNTLIASAVSINTATHPIHVAERIYPTPERSSNYRTLAAPVHIGKNCWIGANATILPGVTIGDNTTIAAGSVVTKNIPANVLAMGVPCRVARSLD